MSLFNILLRSFIILSSLTLVARAQLSGDKFYQRTCPSLHGMVRSTMAKAVSKEPRMGASILRLFFHDCFVNGCDGSVLLDDTPTFTGEKNVIANKNSARGFEVIDDIKSAVEAKCKATVSCADILAIAARDSVVLLGGPTWKVQLGRRDARTASQSDADSDLPPPFASLSTLISMFAAKGLNSQEMTVLSGAYTIGQAHCQAFRNHVYNESNIDTQFAQLRQTNCPLSGGDTNLAPLDSNANVFENTYFKDLVAKKGLLHSDQELFNGGSQDDLVKKYSQDKVAFANDFVAAMIKMGSIGTLTGTEGEIRVNCRQEGKEYIKLWYPILIWLMSSGAPCY